MVKPNHIAVINVFFPPYSYGGATLVASEVARELQRSHDCRITAISGMDQPDMAPYAVMRSQVDGIDSYLINLPRHRSYTERYEGTRVAEITAGLLKRIAPDLVHMHCLQELGAGLIDVVQAQGLPSVLSIHDFWWICERQFMMRPNGQYCGQDPVDINACGSCVSNLDRARTRLGRLYNAATKVDLVTFPSRFAQDLTLSSGLSPRQSVVWENGVQGPGPGFFAAQAARRAADQRLVFGYVGGPSTVKGWPLLRDAFAGLGRDDFAGLLVDASLKGTWWEGQRIGRMRGDWRLHPRYDIESMDAFYAKIDVLLFPSQWKETFGLTVREAATRGIRVIQTDAGGASEWTGAPLAEMLQIGDGPDALRRHIRAALETPKAHPQPLAMPGFADQATTLIEAISLLCTQLPSGRLNESVVGGT